MVTMKVSVKQARDIDATNAYHVVVKEEWENYLGNQWAEPMCDVIAHTDHKGYGLWIDGKQVQGTCQFSAGKNPREAIRRYFHKVYDYPDQ